MSTISAEQQLATVRNAMGPKLLYPTVMALSKLNPARYGELFEELHGILTDEEGRFIMVSPDEETDHAETRPIAEAIYESLSESIGRFKGPGEGIDLATFTADVPSDEPCENCGEIHEAMSQEEAIQRVREHPEDLITALTIVATNGLDGMDLARLAMGGPPSQNVVTAFASAVAVGFSLGFVTASDPVVAEGATDPLDGLEDWLASLDGDKSDEGDR